jgi:microcystin degradation protein MlrC
MGASFVAVADDDAGLAQRMAQSIAAAAWERRHEFTSRLLSPEDAVARAGAAPAGPVALFDVGDNVGGGSPGDSTILLEELRRQGVPDWLVVLHDPESVERCVAAGVRNNVWLEAGAKTDTLHGRPVPIDARVRLLSDGIFVEREVRHGGWGRNDQGVTALVDVTPAGSIVFTSRRMAPMSLEKLLSIAAHPEQRRAIVVKGVVAPRAAYEPVCREILLVDTPGVTAGDPSRFHYRHRRNPLYPLEPNANV